MKNLVFVLGLIFLVSCNTTVATNSDSTPSGHDIFDALLKKYVDEDGMVDYKGLEKDRTKFQEYLRILEANAPNDTSQ
ncbi:MAG: hypothetical protein GY816_10520 [Cytophagales bacterium]|nr:hypothetical protein [Cytophagales bacterium]